MNIHQFLVSRILFIGPYRANCTCGWKGKLLGWDNFGMAEAEWERHCEQQ